MVSVEHRMVSLAPAESTAVDYRAAQCHRAQLQTPSWQRPTTCSACYWGLPVQCQTAGLGRRQLTPGSYCFCTVCKLESESVRVHCLLTGQAHRRWQATLTTAVVPWGPVAPALWLRDWLPDYVTESGVELCDVAWPEYWLIFFVITHSKEHSFHYILWLRVALSVLINKPSLKWMPCLIPAIESAIESIYLDKICFWSPVHFKS